MLYEKIVRNHIDYMIPHNLLVYVLSGLLLLYSPYLFGAIVIAYCLSTRAFLVILPIVAILCTIGFGLIPTSVLLALFPILIATNILILDKIDTLFGYFLTNIAWLIDERTGKVQHHAAIPTLKRHKPKVTIILCNKDEQPEHLIASLQSLQLSKQAAEQQLGLQIRLVLCDGESTNLDVAAVDPLIDALYVKGGGKLTGRDYATRQEDCDIVVSADADRRYSIDCVESLLRPLLGQPEAIACSGDEWELPFSFGTNHYRFNGGCSAYFKVIYEQVPFDLAVNQQRFQDIWYEEEFLFMARMLRYGKIAHFTEANQDQRPVSLVTILKRFLGFERVGPSF